MTLAAEQGFLFFLGSGSALQGWALVEQGQIEEGIAQIRQGLAALRLIGAEAHRPYYLALLADAYGKAGQNEEGLRALTEALALVNKTEARYYEAELHRVHGELLLLRNDLNAAQAESCFRQAIEVARKQSAKSWELRATISLARLLKRQGNREEARTMLGEIYGWFTEGFDTADLKDAKALLAELSA
jgi:predicted ATPase